MEAIIELSSLKTFLAAGSPIFLAVLLFFFLIPQVPPWPEHFSTLIVLVLGINFKICATRGTAEFLSRFGVETEIVNKLLQYVTNYNKNQNKKNFNLIESYVDKCLLFKQNSFQKQVLNL